MTDAPWVAPAWLYVALFVLAGFAGGYILVVFAPDDSGDSPRNRAQIMTEIIMFPFAVLFAGLAIFCRVIGIGEETGDESKSD